MSRLDELIQELCPDGVEYKKLGDIATISRGGSFQKKDFREMGVPCIHYGQIYTRYGLFVDKTISFIDPIISKKQKYAVKNDIVMAVTSENIEDVCKCVAYFGEEPAAISGHTAIIHHNENAKFLVYYLHSAMFFAQKEKIAHGTKVIEVTPDKLNGIVIPVPPLEVQREIVRVLDNYTKIKDELNEKLSAELSARRKQYEYYRDKFFQRDEITLWVKTKDVVYDKFWLMPATPHYISEGVPYITSKNVRNGMIDFGDVKYISINDYQEISKNRKICKGDLLITMIGTIGETAFVGDNTLFYGQNIYLVRLDESKCLRRYFYHYLSSKKVKQALISGKNDSNQGYIKAGSIDNLQFPLPSLDEQRRMVDILDHFELRYNDILSSIPTEIEARTKQYEHYRDKLLTFKRKETA